ncbi:MAG: TRAP transporter large permease subunit [Mesorhizobium sp.]
MQSTETAIPASAPTPTSTIVYALEWLSRAARYVGGAALFSIMALTAADVVLRNLFSMVVPGGVEIISFLMIFVALSTLSLVELDKGHIRVDILLNSVPRFVRLPLTAGGLLLTLATISITTVQVARQSLYQAENGIVASVTRLPEWPFALMAAIFMGLFALALLRNLGSAVAAVLASDDRRSMAILLIWAVAAIAIVWFALRPADLPFDIPRDMRGLACIFLCFVLIFLGVHIAAAMAVSAVLGISLMISPMASLTSLGTTTLDVVRDPTWSAVPLFTWMGLIVVGSGFAESLYRAAYKWIGHLPGGLASASTVACTGLSSIVGDTLSGVYAMGSIALPQMKSYGYDMKLAAASIACAATIGVMLPPSIAFIVYGMITEVSIGKLFLAGILPGILFAVILVGLITVRAMLNPALAPRGPRSSWSERMSASSETWPIIALVLIVLGGIYAGMVTTNEAGGLGACGALVIAALTGRLRGDTFWHSIEQTLRLSTAIMVIFMFATVFSRFIAVSGLTAQLAQIIADLELGKYQLLAAILVFYLIVGMFMNALPLLVLTVPLFFPLAMGAGFDPVWFGVICVVMVELGVVTPPIGVNVFAIAAMTKDVTMYQIFQGVFPFWFAFLILVVLITIFPQIALYLPSMM